MARWRTLVIKLMVILRVHDMKNKAMNMLGRNAYLRVFNKISDQKQQDTKVNKVINREIVGKVLDKPAQGPIITDPSLCEHPYNKMKRHGNKTTKWWTCTECQTRFERKELEDLKPAGPMRDQDLVLFGMHVGKTYLQIYNEQPSYAQWVMQTAESGDSSPDLARLARYLARKEQEDVHVGRPVPYQVPNQETQSESNEDSSEMSFVGEEGPL